MKTMMMILVTLLLSPAGLHAATWKSAPLIDSMCSQKFEDKMAEHTVACAIQCAGGGYGVVVDGQFVKFDDQGNELALKALKGTEQKKNIRVTVQGEIEGGTLHVASLPSTEVPARQRRQRPWSGV